MDSAVMMRRSDAAAHREQGKAYARSSAAAAATWADRTDAWLRALPTDNDILRAAQRAKAATALLRDLLHPDVADIRLIEPPPVAADPS